MKPPECWHQAFSDSKFVNNAVGLALHSLLLVPYHSWRFTHGHHHKSTSHLTRDQAFVPPTYSRILKERGIWEDTPIMNLYKVLVMVLFGWPFYLMTNVASQTLPGRRVNHFEPSSPLFKQSQRTEVIISDIGLLVVLALFYWCLQFWFLQLGLLLCDSLFECQLLAHNHHLLASHPRWRPALHHWWMDFYKGRSCHRRSWLRNFERLVPSHSRYPRCTPFVL